MTYTIKSGDTLSKIAQRNGVSLAQLLQANPQITDPNSIKVGQVITLPNGVSSTDNTKPLPSNVVPQPKPTPAAGALGQAIADMLGSLSA
jgi:morphogenetic protein associated with SpoVID